jgi:hypothetical protein
MGEGGAYWRESQGETMIRRGMVSILTSHKNIVIWL